MNMYGIMHALIDECIYQFLSPLASTGQSFASRAVSSPQTASSTPSPRVKRRLDSTYCRNAHLPACPRTAVSRTPANLPSRWMSLRESSCSPLCRRLLLLVRMLRLTNAVSLAQCIASSLPMEREKVRGVHMEVHWAFFSPRSSYIWYRLQG